MIEILGSAHRPRLRRWRGERCTATFARLRALASSNRLAVDKVKAIDGLRRLPVLKSFRKILTAMFLDRLLLGLAAIITFSAGGRASRTASVAARPGAGRDRYGAVWR